MADPGELDHTDHDPTHRMYDEDTGICCDCPRLVDPLAPIVTSLRPQVRQVFATMAQAERDAESLDDDQAIDPDALQRCLDRVVRVVAAATETTARRDRGRLFDMRMGMAEVVRARAQLEADGWMQGDDLPAALDDALSRLDQLSEYPGQPWRPGSIVNADPPEPPTGTRLALESAPRVVVWYRGKRGWRMPEWDEPSHPAHGDQASWTYARTSLSNHGDRLVVAR